MKHLELFESWSGKPGEISIGFVGTGGIGSHPAVLSKSEKDRIESEGEDVYFVQTDSSNSVPDALACVFNDTDEWTIKAISSSAAKAAMEMIGGNHVDTDKDPGLTNRVARGIGYRPTSRGDMTLITIIPNPKINTVYWSDVPEEEQSYWQPPFRPVPISDVEEM